MSMLYLHRPERKPASKTKKSTRAITNWLKNMEWLDIQRGAVDLELLLVIIALVGFGFTMTFSGYFHFSWLQSMRSGISIYHFIIRQAMWVGLGLIAMVITIFISPKAIYRWTPTFFIIVLLLNLMPALGILSQEIRGGRRWIFLGALSFQPSEFAKLALALYLTRVIHGHQEKIATSLLAAMRPMIMIAVMGLTIFFQNDLSTSIFLLGSSILTLFMGGMSLRYLGIQIMLIIGAGVAAILSTPFRMQRVMIWLNGSDNDILGNSRQALMSIRAIEGSGLGGTGLGAGFYKLGRISLVQSDYIFAAVVEELGLLGILSVIGLFLALLYKAYQIGSYTKNRYISFLAITLAMILAGQAFLNMAVVVGILPVTGLPLPFFSAGGSNIFVSLIICGLILNLSRKEQKA